MFGHVPQAGELAIDGSAPDAPPPFRGPIVHTRDTIRAEAEAQLAEARAAPAMPWHPSVLHSRRAAWNRYMEWLRPEEVAELTVQWHAELTRWGEPFVNGPWQEHWFDEIYGDLDDYEGEDENPAS